MSLKNMDNLLLYHSAITISTKTKTDPNEIQNSLHSKNPFTYYQDSHQGSHIAFDYLSCWGVYFTLK